jgi:hypothetical protein
MATTPSQHRFEGCQKFVRVHAFAVIGIDVARFDDTVPADDESSRDRQHPGLIALVRGDVESARLHCLALLVADPEQKIEFQGVAIVDVGENRERPFGVGLELGSKPLSSKSHLSVT